MLDVSGPAYDIIVALMLLSIGAFVGLVLGLWIGVKHIDVRVHRHPKPPMRWHHHRKRHPRVVPS